MKKRLSRKAAYIMLGVVFLLMVAALIVQVVMEGKLTSEIAVRTLIPMGACASAFAKVYTGAGRNRGLAYYEKSYEKEIGTAFSEPHRKAEKNMLLRGIKAYNEDRFTVAVKHLSPLFSRCQTSAESTATGLFLGLTYTDMGLPDKAIETYEALLAIDPNAARAWNNLGLLYAKKGMPDKAAEHYRRATECDPTYVMAFNNMAQILLRDSRWQDAIRFASHALSLQSDLVPALNAMAVAHYALGHKAESRQYVDRVVMAGGNTQNLKTIFALLDHGKSPFEPHTRLTPELETALELFERRNAIPMLRICLPADGPDIGRSRLGGEAFGDVPTDSHGYPMRLLAAIWCSEARGIPDLPDRGILRFFIAADASLGCDRHAPASGADFRVLYTEDEDAFGSCRYEMTFDPQTSFPVKGCIPIYFQPGMSTPLVADYRFRPALSEALMKAGAPTLDDLDPSAYAAICRQNTYGGHRMGGYPCFEDIDPREYEPYRRYDTLLLQIVTHTVETKHGDVNIIEFGNEGGCQFLISRDNLLSRNFSDVFYWWDDVKKENFD